MIEICFEGDGILGIEWGNENGSLIVKDVLKNTVADEYYELEKGLMVLKINDEDFEELSYIKKISMIMNLWRENNEIKILFEKKKLEEYVEIRQFLEENGFAEYYDQFIELGAKKIEDFEFIEKEDLYVMGITLDEAERLYKKIKMKNKSEVFEEL